MRGQEGKQAGEFEPILIEVYDNGGKVVGRRHGPQLASMCEQVQEVFVECTVQTDGSKVFTVLPCTFEPGVKTTYTLTWYCNKKATFKQFQSTVATANKGVEAK